MAQLRFYFYQCTVLFISIMTPVAFPENTDLIFFTVFNLKYEMK